MNIIYSRIVVLTSLLLIFLIHSNAQLSNQMVVNPTMKVSNLDSRTENPMRLGILKIDIKVIGQVAVTSLDMTFYNDNSRVMEGEFNFPLGEGQSISQFALDINGVMRDGVIVEKEQGRKTFEAITRRRVDPGLLEMTEGNNFKARVFPLPAKGSRRIKITFEQELTDKGEYDLYLLPLKITTVVGKFLLHIEVVKNQVKLDNENNELTNIIFKQWNDSYVSSIEQDNYKPDRQLGLALPHLSDSTKTFVTNLSNNSDSSYFYLNIRPKLIVENKSLPKKITLLWDNSNSAKNRDIEKELTLLDSYIQRIGNLQIELVTFNIKIENAQEFEITNGNWDSLKSTLKALNYDGGTSLGIIDFSVIKSDEVLLFTDGISTFGNTEPKISKTIINTINSSISANHSFLMYIAQSSGGVYVNLNKLTNNEAFELLKNSNYQFISANVQDGKITNCYPNMPCQFNNSFSFSGILASKDATVILNFGFGNTIKYSKKIKLLSDNCIELPLLKRLWAEKKIASLNLNVDKNKNEITQVGKDFGIVTQNTSLIVLENLSDYLQYNIVPPKEMQEAYFNQKLNTEKSLVASIQSHIDRVVVMSDMQSKWWNTKYPLPTEQGNNAKSSSNQVKFTSARVTNSNSQRKVSLVSGSASAPQTQVVEVEVYENIASSSSEIAEPGFFSGVQNNNWESNSRIKIDSWNPQTPYLKVLQYSNAGQEYTTYLKLKAEYGTTPAFYIDASDYFLKIGKKDTSVLILSNLAELELEAPQLLRVLGKKLLALKHNAEAVLIFEKVLKLKGEEPQSYRDLGLAYEANGNYQQAINILYEVIKKEWDGRFSGIEIIVMNEINNIIAIHSKLDYSFIDKRLVKQEPVAIRVVLTWDTDNCDMDLWLTDPTGEKCFFENKITQLGGKISNDLTGGYGPEEIMIKNAIKGNYNVQTNYFGTRSQTILAPVNLNLKFFTNYGKRNQKEEEVNLRLENQKDIIDIGSFIFKK